MKLTSEQEEKLQTACDIAAWPIVNGHGVEDTAEQLRVLAETCISIGVEIAMQHRHVMREHEGVVLHTGPAEVIDHE